MEVIGGQKIWSWLDGPMLRSTVASNAAIRSFRGHPVSDYRDLARKVAELQFQNRDHVLLFRGQTADYKDKPGKTTLKASLFRGATPQANPTLNVLKARFLALADAERELADNSRTFKLIGWERIVRQRLLRWSILQHYDICKTPLLDVTQSLRNAASMASYGAHDEAYVFVIGVPAISGAITTSSEAGLQIIRLSSACPPSAVRPHIQEGYLLSEYPEIADLEQKKQRPHSEMDFARRLIAKFRFDPKKFWATDDTFPFPKVAKEALFQTKYRQGYAHMIDHLKIKLQVAWQKRGFNVEDLCTKPIVTPRR